MRLGCCSAPPAGLRRYHGRSPVRRISRLCRRRCSRDGWRRRAQARSTWRVAAKAAPRPPVLVGLELWLDGLATLFTDSYEAAVPILRRAHSGFDAGDMPASEQVRWKWLATVLSIHMWDDVRWQAISEAHVQIAREAGALGELPLALSQRVYAHLFAGELTTAALLVDEIRAASEATGSNLTPYGAVGLAALRGREPEAISLIDESRQDATRRGEGVGLSVLDWAQALLYNGLGRYDEARVAALRVAEYPHDLSTSNWGMVELIEAAVRAGTPELAADARSRLAEMARVSGTDWAVGIAARSEALFADDRASRGALCRGGRSTRSISDGRRSRSCSPSLRRMAETSTPTHRCTQANCGRRTTSSPTSAWRRSPSARASSWRRPASTPASAPSRRWAD